MDVLESLETRWFLAEADAALTPLNDWFSQTQREGKRIDHYLVSGRDDLGFKARIVEHQATKIETKYLLGSLGPTRLAPGIVGQIERWRKLSLSVDDPELRKDGMWCAIEKERRLRKFTVEGGVASEVAVESRPSAGCVVELTRLRIHESTGGDVAWTLGLEAFGTELVLLEILQTTCCATLGDGLKLELGRELSMSYPTWLKSAWRRDR